MQKQKRKKQKEWFLQAVNRIKEIRRYEQIGKWRLANLEKRTLSCDLRQRKRKLIACPRWKYKIGGIDAPDAVSIYGIGDTYV